MHLLDLVGDQVKVDVELGTDAVLHRDLDGVLLLVGNGRELQGRVDDVGDAKLEEALGSDGPTCREVELARELASVGPIIFLIAVTDTHNKAEANTADCD